jgi:nitroimidazol reductase NimA-like FMN-containing flavoprotein (pyridoxamine 5'-phosphate oxidase superfamily)
MSESTAIRFRALDQAEIESLLARNHVGRLAFTFHDHVDIEPVSYVYADGVIKRTSGNAVASPDRRQV